MHVKLQNKFKILYYLLRHHPNALHESMYLIYFVSIFLCVCIVLLFCWNLKTFLIYALGHGQHAMKGSLKKSICWTNNKIYWSTGEWQSHETYQNIINHTYLNVFWPNIKFICFGVHFEKSLKNNILEFWCSFMSLWEQPEHISFGTNKFWI